MNTDPVVAQSASGWRFKTGMAIVGLVIGSWLSVPVAAAAGIPGTTIAALTGALFIINKVLLVVAIAIMGKRGFEELKRRLFSSVTGWAPRASAEVGPFRHRLGIGLFCLPLISGFLEPYIDAAWPGLRPNLWQLQLLGDSMLIVSVFVLGGNFWDKVRALFVRSARVTYADVI